MADGASAATMPALALIDPVGMLQRSTEEFSRRCNGAASLIERHPEIERVLSGELDHAVTTIDEVEFEVTALNDRSGTRHALVSANGGPLPEAAALGPTQLDESPALAWMKDIEGRYLHVNRRYAEVMGTTAERLVGHTDRELPAREVVDGPRLLDGAVAAEEPLQLEYTIPEFEGRPALAVLRFPLFDADGSAVGMCGVAAPLAEAHLARSESARLMRLERWRHLDPDRIRRELLEEWGLVPETVEEPTPEPESQSEPEPAVEAFEERDEMLAQNAALAAEAADLQRELGEGQRRIAALHEASATAARRAHELMSALTQEQERSAQLERELERARTADAVSGEAELLRTQLEEERSRVAQLGDELRRERERAEAARPAHTALQEAQAEAKQFQFELQSAHAALQRARADAQAANEALSTARGEAGDLQDELAVTRAQLAEALKPKPAAELPPLRWTPAAQRALAAALIGATEWRTGLKDVLKVLGAEGGWDAVTAWAPGERTSLRCVAMWTRRPDHGQFETLTWQRPTSMAAGELGWAASSEHAVAIESIETSSDPRLKVAAAEGMRTAMLVPIRDGVSVLGLLELLSSEPKLPEGELAISLEAVALQLGHFAHLLRLGARPRWSLGRV